MKKMFLILRFRPTGKKKQTKKFFVRPAESKMITFFSFLPTCRNIPGEQIKVKQFCCTMKKKKWFVKFLLKFRKKKA